MSTAMNVDTKKLFKGAIMLALMIGIGFIPAPESMTPFGMKVFGIFVGMIYGWVFIEIGAPSLIGLVIYALSGCGTMGEIIPAAFGTQVVLMLVAMFFMVACVQTTGLGKFLADWIMHRKMLKGRPYLFFAAYLVASYLVAFASNTMGAIMIMSSLFLGIKDAAGFKTNSKECCLFILGILIAANLSDLALPMKGTAAMYTAIYPGLSNGAEFDGLRWIAAILPITVVTIIAYILAVKFIFRPDFGKLSNAIEYVSSQPALKSTKEQRTAALVLGIFVCALLIPTIPFRFAAWKALQALGIGGLSILVVGVCYFIKVDDKPLLNIPKLAGNFYWDALMMVPAIQLIIAQLSSEKAGFAAFMQKLFLPLVENMNATAMVLTLIALTVILTNFINNLVAGSVMVTLASVLLPAFPELNIAQLFFILTVCSMTSYALPSANPSVALAFSLKEHVQLGKMIKYGTISTAVFIGMLCIFAWPLVKFIF